MKRICLIFILVFLLRVCADSQQKKTNISFSKNLPALPTEFESKRTIIPEYYQKILFANKEAFEPKTTLQDTGFSLVGHWAWGPCYAVDVKGNYAYVASGPTMLVLDISNPKNLFVVTEYKTQTDASGNVNDIKIRDSLLYLLDGSSFQILNIKNPTEPELISILYSSVTDKMVLNDSLAFILHMNNGAIRIVNIKDPFNPFFTKGFGGVGFGETSISVMNNVVYVGNFEIDGDGLNIFDCRNPDSLSLDVFYDVNGWVTESFVQDTLLLVGVDGRPNSDLKIYSISDPLYPQFLSKVYLGSNMDGYNISGIVVRGTSAFVATLRQGIYEIDISNPLNPFIKDHLLKRSQFYNGTGANVVAASKYIFTSTVTGMWCISTFPGDSLRSYSFFPCGSELFDIAIRDTLAYVADYNGIGVLNISDPTKPYRITEVEAPGNSLTLRIYNNFIFLSLGLDGLAIFDISNPKIPNYVSYNRDLLAADLILKDSILFVLNNDSLIVLNIKNTTQAKRIGGYSLPSQSGSYSNRLTLQDSILYIAKEDSGIWIFDIKIPSNPKLVTVNKTVAASLQKKDNLLYVLGNGFLSIFDISVPSILNLKSKIMTDGYYTTPIVFDKSFLYYKFYSELHSIDLTDPFFPVNKGTYKLIFGGFDGLDTYRSYIFTTDIVKGVKVLKNNFITKVTGKNEFMPHCFQLFQNYPNPFNPLTTLRYSLPKRSYIKLVVYNMIGQEIITLLNGIEENGEHEVLFNASTVASGIYFYRLTTDTFTESRKMVVIK